MKNIHLFVVLIVISLGAFAQEKEIPYTLADRDRLIRVEAEISSLRNEMVSFRNETNAKIEGVKSTLEAKIDGVESRLEAKIDANGQRITDLQTLLYWGFGVLFSMMLFMLGYNIWDRRTLMNPIKERQDKIIQILKMADEDNITFREAMKRASLW